MICAEEHLEVLPILDWKIFWDPLIVDLVPTLLVELYFDLRCPEEVKDVGIKLQGAFEEVEII